MPIVWGNYLVADRTGAFCIVCKKKRSTLRSIQRHYKQKHEKK